MSAPRVLGAVLAGGASSRFGADKALAIVAGVSLVDRARATLAHRCEEVVVVSSRAPGPGVPTIPDLRPPCGPLGGIEAALTWASSREADAVFVLACDLPLVTPDTVEAIVAAFPLPLPGAPGRAVAVAATRDDRIEPVCACYGVGCLTHAGALLDGGRRAAGALFEAVEGVRVRVPAEELLNVNTPEARDRAEARLRARRSVSAR